MSVHSALMLGTAQLITPDSLAGHSKHFKTQYSRQHEQGHKSFHHVTSSHLHISISVKLLSPPYLRPHPALSNPSQPLQVHAHTPYASA